MPVSQSQKSKLTGVGPLGTVSHKVNLIIIFAPKSILEGAVRGEVLRNLIKEGCNHSNILQNICMVPGPANVFGIEGLGGLGY